MEKIKSYLQQLTTFDFSNPNVQRMFFIILVIIFLALTLIYLIFKPVESPSPAKPTVINQSDDEVLKLIQEPDGTLTVESMNPDLSEAEVRQKLGLDNDTQIVIKVPKFIRPIPSDEFEPDPRYWNLPDEHAD